MSTGRGLMIRVFALYGLQGHPEWELESRPSAAIEELSRSKARVPRHPGPLSELRLTPYPPGGACDETQSRPAKGKLVSPNRVSASRHRPSGCIYIVAM